MPGTDAQAHGGKMKNPFHLKPLPLSVPFCDREKEMSDLMRYAGNFTNVVLSSPRRYGKTSLIKRVQDNLAKHGTLTIYIDYFGISSIDEFSARFAGAVYSVVYKEKSLFEKAAKVFTSLRPIMRPDPETGMAFTVEVAKSKPGGQLLEETLKGFGEFLKSGKITCNVAFDEFQEITELKESRFIEGTLRSYMQDHRNVSYFFIGSRSAYLWICSTTKNARSIKAPSTMSFPRFQPKTQRSISPGCSVKTERTARYPWQPEYTP